MHGGQSFTERHRLLLSILRSEKSTWSTSVFTIEGIDPVEAGGKHSLPAAGLLHLQECHTIVLTEAGLRMHTFLEGHPNLRMLLKNGRVALWRGRIALHSKVDRVEIDPLRLLWVSPSRITQAGIGWWHTLHTYRKRNEFGRVAGGDWDLNTMPFEDLDVFRAYEAHFVQGARWENTGFYRRLQALFNRGIRIRRMANLNEYLKYLDTLFESILRNGYKTRYDLCGSNGWPHTIDEVTVRIGRYGDFLFEDGVHRLAIAKLLKLTRLPVMVTWRHLDWYRLRVLLLNYARRNGGRINQLLTNPDLADIQTAETDARFELMRANLPFSGGSLVDIGAKIGYFCHKFEELGFHCYAVEKDPNAFSILNRLKRAECRHFTAANKDISEFWERTEFDVMLALNVLHHYFKTPEEYEKLVHFLEEVRTRIMFFEPHSANDPQMRGAYRNLLPEDSVTFIADKLGLPRRRCIGCSEQGRPIYMLTKD